jgi:transposase InsO family protein
MSLRHEFVQLALQDGANRRELCRRFGISPQTGYKWLARFDADKNVGLHEHSRRPDTSPRKTDPSVEAAVVDMRKKHPAWGGRKISRRLGDLKVAAIAPSTVTSILHRHRLITPEASMAATPWRRFEHDIPNALWQIDFKGYFPTPEGNCHPLTVLDDHSRFNLALRACGHQTYRTVQAHLSDVFRRYGLPVRINGDNGAPWGCSRQPGQVTELAIWLIRHGIRLSFSRPYHPQTNGKDERFHRSLKAEVLNGRSFVSLGEAQDAFDRWRHVYNHERPHDALAMATPDTRYQLSPRVFLEALAPIEYGPNDTVVKVKWNGELPFKGRRFKVSNPLVGLPVGIRPKPEEDGLYDVYLLHHRLMMIDLRQPLEST